MKHNIFYFIALTLFLFSCKKEEKPDYLAIDIQKIEQYLQEHQLQAQRLESGLFYIIEKAGDINRPTPNSMVTVSYRGTFLDGTEFDSSSGFTGSLSHMIRGWQQGIPLIGAGGKIRLFIPSPLGYGDKAYGKIPANSPLIFDVSLFHFSD